jgi:hypothetical protein
MQYVFSLQSCSQEIIGFYKCVAAVVVIGIDHGEGLVHFAFAAEIRRVRYPMVWSFLRGMSLPPVKSSEVLVHIIGCDAAGQFGLEIWP